MTIDVIGRLGGSRSGSGAVHQTLGLVVVLLAVVVFADPDPLRATLNGPDHELLAGIRLIADEIEFSAAFAERVTRVKALALYDRVVLSPVLTDAERVAALSTLVRAVNRDPITDMITNLAAADLAVELMVCADRRPAPVTDLSPDVVELIADALAQLEPLLDEPSPVRPHCPPPFHTLLPKNDLIAGYLLRAVDDLVDDHDLVLGLLRYGIRLPPMTTPGFPTPTQASVVPLFRPGLYADFVDLIRDHVGRGRCDIAEALVRMPIFKRYVKADPGPFAEAVVAMVAAPTCDDFFLFLAHPHDTPLALEIPGDARALILAAAIDADRDPLLPLIFTMFRDGFFKRDDLGARLVRALFSRDPRRFAARLALFEDLEPFWQELHRGSALIDWLQDHFHDAYLHVFQYLLSSSSLYAVRMQAARLVADAYRHDAAQKKVFALLAKTCPDLRAGALAPGADRPSWMQAVLGRKRAQRSAPAQGDGQQTCDTLPDDSNIPMMSS